MRLSGELKAMGWTNGPTGERREDEFREKIADTFNGLYRAWTDEELLCNPREALHFCNAVRVRCGVPDAPDSVILRTLTNMRKNGDSITPLRKRSRTTEKHR